jgi:hypothetical protein
MTAWTKGILLLAGAIGLAALLIQVPFWIMAHCR